MVDPLHIWLLAAGAGLLFLAGVWVVGVAWVCWDMYRRDLPVQQQIKWGALCLLPVVGVILYLLAFRRSQPQQEPKRVTMLKPQRTTPPAREFATIAAVDYTPPVSLKPSTVPAPSLTWVLKATQGPHSGQRFVLDRLPARIGRVADAAVCLDRDEGVSRKHAELHEKNGALWVSDLGSTHGTRINEQPVVSSELVAGDRVHVGLSTLIVSRERPDAWPS